MTMLPSLPRFDRDSATKKVRDGPVVPGLSDLGL